MFKTRFLLQSVAWCLILFGSGACVVPADAQRSDPVVCLQTTKGPIYIQVYLSRAPYTSRNFLDLVNRGFYNGLSFHRVESWCVQGGDPNGNGTGNFVDPQTGAPRYIRRELGGGLSHRAPGVVAMARGKHPDSASCQFYITKRPMPGLDGQYAIFGYVVNGINSVYSIVPGDRIESASIVSNGGDSQSSGQSNQPIPQPAGESGF